METYHASNAYSKGKNPRNRFVRSPPNNLEYRTWVSLVISDRMWAEGVAEGVALGVAEGVVKCVGGSARSQNWVGGVVKGVGVGVAGGI